MPASADACFDDACLDDACRDDARFGAACLDAACFDDVRPDLDRVAGAPQAMTSRITTDRIEDRPIAAGPNTADRTLPPSAPHLLHEPS